MNTSTDVRPTLSSPEDQEAWIQLFASRITACWPRLDAADAEHVGDGLSREERWRSIDPTLAAERWMAQVMGHSPVGGTAPAATPHPTETTP